MDTQTNQYPFLAWDWDTQEFKIIPETDVIKAIYYAWSYEFCVHEAGTEDMIFNPMLDNEWNNDLLEKYKIKIFNHNGKRCIWDYGESGFIYQAPWNKGDEQYGALEL